MYKEKNLHPYLLKNWYKFKKIKWCNSTLSIKEWERVCFVCCVLKIGKQNEQHWLVPHAERNMESNFLKINIRELPMFWQTLYVYKCSMGIFYILLCKNTKSIIHNREKKWSTFRQNNFLKLHCSKVSQSDLLFPVLRLINGQAKSQTNNVQ